MSDPWVFLLATLAAYRLTRLVTSDKITEPIFEPLRQRLEERWITKHAGSDENLAYLFGQSETWNSKLAFLLSCSWCLGFWVSGLVSVLVSLVYGFDYLSLIGWFAMATGVGLLGKIGNE